MTVRAFLRIPEDRKSALLHVLEWIADVNGFTLEGGSSRRGDSIVTLEYGDLVLAQELRPVSTRVLIRIPFLDRSVPDSATPSMDKPSETFAMKWVSEGSRLFVRGPRIPVQGEKILAVWEHDSQAAVSMTNGSDHVTIQFGSDIIGSVFSSLAQVEEQGEKARDPHGRYPQADTFAVRHHVLRCPIASDSALTLGKAIRAGCIAAGEPWVSKALWPEACTRIAVVTHDVDSIRKWTTRRLLGALKQTFRDQGRIGIEGVGRRVFGLLAQLISQDPHRNLDMLRSMEAEAGVSATYFVQMSKGSNRREPFAQYDWRGRYLHGQLRKLHSDGHELALHASYESADRAEMLKIEAGRLTTFCQPLGVRQHYLRSNPVLIDAYRSGGLLYDSTIGYSEFVGFRSGACHPYGLEDCQSSSSSNPLEIPFAVMDSALDAEAHSDISAMESILADLSATIGEREGVFVSIWHNHYLDGELIKPGSVLSSLITQLANRGWSFMTLLEIADWWVRRRGVQLSRLGPGEWEILPERDIRNLSLRVTPPLPVSVEGTSPDGWSVKTDNRETVVTLFGLQALTPVRMHTRGGTVR